MAQTGSALAWGARGHGFKSRRPDHDLKIMNFPSWIRQPLTTTGHYRRVSHVLHQQGLHTVCSSALCPNRHECWQAGTATFMILGDACTRSCPFCGVSPGDPTAPSPDEPRRIALAVQELALRHVVLTSVTRDDLVDGGASHFAATINAIRQINPTATTEILIPDFQGHTPDIDIVLAARPDVFGHNLETVTRLHPQLRPQASYQRSLAVLRYAADHGAAIVKSGLMLGLGERPDEIESTLHDLSAAGCNVVTLGQYLRPRRNKVPVVRYVPPEEFASYQQRAVEFSLQAIIAGPLVRSSYRAHEVIAKLRQ